MMSFRAFRISVVALLFFFLAVAVVQGAGVESLTRQLSSGSEKERIEAAKELGKKGKSASSAVSALCKAVKEDDSSKVRAEAIRALGEMEVTSDKVIQTLIHAFTDKVYLVRQQASMTCGRKMGKAAVPHLTKIIYNKKTSYQKLSNICQTLKRTEYDPRSVKALLTIDGTGAKERLVFTTISAYGARAIPQLEKSLKNTDAGIRRMAALCLGEIRSKDKKRLELLVTTFRKDKSDKVRAGAARAMADCEGVKKHLSLLLSNLDTTSDSLRDALAYTLGKMGKDARKAIPKLISFLDSPNSDVRETATVALGRINSDPRRVVPALIKRLDDVDGDVVTFAIRALGKFGDRAKPAQDKLIEVLKESSNSSARGEAALLLGKLEAKPKEVVPLILETIEKSRSARKLYKALIEYGPRAAPAYDLAKKLIEKKSTYDKEMGILLLGAIQKPGTISFLKKLYRKSDDYRVKGYVIEALGSFTSQSSQVLPFISRAADSKNHSLRWAAVKSLAKLYSTSSRARSKAFEIMKEGERWTEVEAFLSVIQKEKDRKAIPVLKYCLKTNRSSSVRKKVLETLKVFGLDPVSLLIDLIKKSKDKKERGRHIMDLSNYPEEGRRFQSLLKKVMLKGTSYDMIAASSVLRKMGTDAIPILVDVIEESARSKNINAHSAASHRLGRLGKDALPAVKKLLGSRDKELRKCGIIAAGAMGPEAKPVVPRIITLLKRDTSENRSRALSALEDIEVKNRRVKKALEKAIKSDKAPANRGQAAETMATLYPDSSQTIKLIVNLIKKESDPYALAKAVRALGKVTTKKRTVIKILLFVLKNAKSDSVKKAAIQALGDQGEEARKAIPHIKRAARGKGKYFGRTAERAIKKIRGN